MYQGASSVFKVGEPIAINEITFKNSYGTQVEIWFYHPNDFLRWIAYDKHILTPNEKYLWKVPSGWGKVQVRFTGPGKWKTISGGESVNITAEGNIENLV